MLFLSLDGVKSSRRCMWVNSDHQHLHRVPCHVELFYFHAVASTGFASPCAEGKHVITIMDLFPCSGLGNIPGDGHGNASLLQPWWFFDHNIWQTRDISMLFFPLDSALNYTDKMIYYYMMVLFLKTTILGGCGVTHPHKHYWCIPHPLVTPLFSWTSPVFSICKCKLESGRFLF